MSSNENNNEEENTDALNVNNLQILENNSDDINSLKKKNQDMRGLLFRVINLLKEKTSVCINLEKQNKALSLQIISLKDVVAITKNLLGIRNTEVENMHKEMSSLEEKISAERERQNQMITTVNNANRINDDIKVEYQSQMNIFQQLRDKYNEKVDLLTQENKRLQNEIQELNAADTLSNETIAQV